MCMRSGQPITPFYPDKSRGTQYTVKELYATVAFRVLVDEQVPAGLTNLLPTAQVNCGNYAVREYTQQVLAAAGLTGSSDDADKVKAVYAFLINGDGEGSFVYTYYDQIFPGYLKSSFNSIFTASHFLKRRVGVCNDFAELFAAMVRSMNIPVMKVRGYNTASQTGHMWNKVYFDGQWWRLDATWANGSVAAGYGSSAYAEWSATTAQMVTFADDHENTYTKDFMETF